MAVSASSAALLSPAVRARVSTLAPGDIAGATPCRCCGNDTHPVYGLVCEDCWADAQPRSLKQRPTVLCALALDHADLRTLGLTK